MQHGIYSEFISSASAFRLTRSVDAEAVYALNNDVETEEAVDPQRP
jgi:hypothetical protein